MFQSYKLESLGVSILQTWKLGGLLKTLCEGSHNYSVCTMVQREDTECRLHHRRVQNACEGFCFSLSIDVSLHTCRFNCSDFLWHVVLMWCEIFSLEFLVESCDWFSLHVSRDAIQKKSPSILWLGTRLCPRKMCTLWKLNIAIENGP